jgi:hypothetical protein
MRADFEGNNSFFDGTKTASVPDNFTGEGGESFYRYLSCLGIANDPNLLVLSSRSHYYYDYNELKNVKALINLKELNLIEQLDTFINSINIVVSPQTDFIGCFYDRNNQKRIGLFEKIYHRFLNFIDSRVFIEIDKQDVERLLKSNGFEVIDMTEINGITYFRTRNIDKKKKLQS